MLATYLSRENNFPFPLSDLRLESGSMGCTHARVQNLNRLIKYLTELRREETINNDDFNKLVKMASAAFAEAEISNRIDNVLGSKTLNKALNDQLLRFPA